MSQPSAPQGEQWTILRLLDWTTRFFESKDIDTARLDAELLLAHALECRRIDLYARYDQVPTGEPLAQFREMVRARGQRVPAKYLVGTSEFYSLTFDVGPSVLVPRPETEFLVERALELMAPDADITVADLGTGTGAIAIALATQRPQAHIVATDLSPDALAVAKANAQRHEVTDRVEFREGSWFQAFEPASAFDVIASNPPYVADHELANAMPEVRDHEPRLALEAGTDGLDALRVLVPGAAAWLVPGGWLIVEIGAGQAKAVTDLAEATGDYDAIAVAPDFQGIDRVVSMQTKR